MKIARQKTQVTQKRGGGGMDDFWTRSPVRIEDRAIIAYRLTETTVILRSQQTSPPQRYMVHPKHPLPEGDS